MQKLFKACILILLGLVSFSCASQNEQQAPQIRIVDLQGKPRSVTTRMPEMNAQAMANQGRQAVQTALPPMRQEPAAAPQADYGEFSSQAIQQTLQPAQQQTVYVKPAPIPAAQNSNPSILGAATPENRTEEVEYDLAQDYTQENAGETLKEAQEKLKKPAKVTATIKPLEKKSPKSDSAKIGKVVPLKVEKAGKKTGQFYVQVGSFSSVENAKQALTKMQKFHKGKVETIEGEKTIHRVLLGPFSNRQKTNDMVTRIKSSGHEAILVKN
jgi:cell division protein FtsN